MRAAAVVFDFNGTISDDEPVLARVYQELIPGLTEAEYYATLAGHTDEHIFEGDAQLTVASNSPQSPHSGCRGRSDHDDAAPAVQAARRRQADIVELAQDQPLLRHGLAAGHGPSYSAGR